MAPIRLILRNLDDIDVIHTRFNSNKDEMENMYLRVIAVKSYVIVYVYYLACAALRIVTLLYK